jgi:hypothetical protein
MIHRSTSRVVELVVVIALILTSCTTTSPPSTEESDSLAAGQAASEEAEDPTPEPTATTPPPTPTVAHVMTPGEPLGTTVFLSDVNAASSAPNGGVVLGERYETNRFERPFDGPNMNYLRQIDLTNAAITHDDTWLYFTLTLAGESEQGGYTGSYGIELDLDLDGRGDLLIVAQQPSSTNWAAEGVQVYSDLNDDVGGVTPLNADAPPPASDGYETLVYDSGFGDDPDLAWARIQPAEDSAVQIAVKKSLTAGDLAFLWGGWSFGEAPSVAMLDLNDQFSIEQAGSPVIDSTYYPLGELAQVDNTCRMYFGFTPTGSEPGICAIYGTVQNCTYHPLVMEPGGRMLTSQVEAGAILTDVLPGTYTFYDQNVFDNDNNHPAILTATLSPFGLIQVTVDGNGNAWACP